MTTEDARTIVDQLNKIISILEDQFENKSRDYEHDLNVEL